MPQMKFIKGFLPSFLRGSSADADEHDQESQSHAAGSEVMGETAERAGVATGAKRKAREDGMGSTSSKKLRRPSDDEYRLSGHGNGGGLPKDARRIAMPASETPDDDAITVAPRDEPRPNPTRAVRSKPGANRFMLQNTINNTQPGRTGTLSKNNDQVFRQTTRQQTNGSRTAGHPFTVPPTNAHVGDAFRSNEPTSKRQRTSGAPKSTRARAAEVIDLSDSPDDAPKSNVVAVNGKSVRKSQDSQQSVISVDSQAVSQAPVPPTDWFAPVEMRDLNNRTGAYTGPSKPKKRKTPQESTGHSTPSGSSRAHQPLAARKHSEHQSTEDASRPSPTSMKGNRPPINLSKGDGEAGDDIRRRMEDNDVEHLTGAAARLLRRQPASKSQMHESDIISRKAAPKASQGQAPQSPSRPTADQGLRHQFRREEQPGSKRKSVREAMQDTPAKEPAQAVVERVVIQADSPDQLLSGNTVPSKKAFGGHAIPQPSKASGQTQPTQAPRSMHQAKQVEDEIDEPGARIALQSIFSRGCVLETKGRKDNMWIDLVWREEEQHYEVHENGKPCRMSWTDKVMSIGKVEASTWHAAAGSTKVMLKGSSSRKSNGKILLMFLDDAGSKNCSAALLNASGDTMTFKPENARWMDRTFETTGLELTKDYQKQENIAKMQSTKTKAEQQHNAKAASSVKRRDDGIIYESTDQSEGRISARAKMQDHAEETASPGTTSRFFPDGDAQGTRRTTRQPKPVKIRTPTPQPPERWTHVNNPAPWAQSVMYPQTGPRRVTVDFHDLERLDEGEFLNDNIVGYALRRIEENMAPEHKSKVHFFNSFFFTALTTKNGKKAFNYEAVQKWTKQKDLFATPYIVVPINESLHWYVAIICNLPNLGRKTATLGDQESDAVATPSTSQQPSGQPSPIRDPEIQDSQEPIKNDQSDVPGIDKLSLSDKSDVFEFGDDDKVVGSAHEPENEEGTERASGKANNKKTKKRVAPPPKRYPVDGPTIITLDSFGVAHGVQVANLKDYVRREGFARRGMEIERDDIQGLKATDIPEQPNFWDCGLYLVGYVEEFAKDPEKFINKVLSRQLNPNVDFAGFDPSKKREELRNDLMQLSDSQGQARQQQKKAKKMEKDKIAATAITAAGGPAPAAAVTRVESAETQDPTEPSVQAASLSAAPSAKASPVPSPKPERLQPSGPTALTESHAAVQASRAASPKVNGNGNGDGDDDLEESVPRALTIANPGNNSRKRKSPEPDQGSESAAAPSEDGKDMLDSAEEGEAQAQDETLRREAKMHKVKSPELEGIVHAFPHGPSGATSSHGSKSPSADKSSS